MENIKVKLVKAGKDSETVSIDEVLTLLENNRNRVRNLSNLVMTVCGLLLSTSFVVLFFVLQDRLSIVPSLVPILIFASTASLIASILYSIFSSMLPLPAAVRTKMELIDTITRIYHREYKRVAIAVVFLLLGIILFVISLVAFAIASI